VKVQSGNYVFVSGSGGKPERKEEKSGRPNSLSGERLEQLLSVYYSRPYSLRQLGDMFGVSRMTVWRAVQGASFQMM
jgi:DNA-binding transcriptional regulator LsrR (DeoR family)